jgi:hypothetical protein
MAQANKAKILKAQIQVKIKTSLLVGDLPISFSSFQAA